MQKLGFGEFAERTYVDILMYKPRCVEFLLGSGDDGSPDKGKFTEWAKYKNVEIAAGEKTGDAE